MRISTQLGLYASAIGMILSGLGTMIGAVTVSELIILELVFILSIIVLTD